MSYAEFCLVELLQLNTIIQAVCPSKRYAAYEIIPIRIREDLIDEDKKLKVLLAANFQRPKNSESKQRKVADEYVRLCGYKQGGNGSNQYVQKDHNGLFAKLTLDDIALQLGTSKRELQRALRIERNLTDSMK